jgi:hypothetical protein
MPFFNEKFTGRSFNMERPKKLTFPNRTKIESWSIAIRFVLFLAVQKKWFCVNRYFSFTLCFSWINRIGRVTEFKVKKVNVDILWGRSQNIFKSILIFS